MRDCLRLSCVALAFVAAAVLLPTAAEALEVSMGGTFTMNYYNPDPPDAGDDLMAILHHENSWQVLLHDAWFTCDYNSPMPMYEEGVTTLRATSFDFTFSGPDAAVLNAVVASQFTQGGFDSDGYFRVIYNNDSGSVSVDYAFYIWPPVPSEGVYFEILGLSDLIQFPLNEGCPSVGPFELDAYQTTLFDRRSEESNGNLSANDASTIWLEFGSPTSDESWGTIKALYR